MTLLCSKPSPFPTWDLPRFGKVEVPVAGTVLTFVIDSTMPEGALGFYDGRYGPIETMEMWDDQA